MPFSEPRRWCKCEFCRDVHKEGSGRKGKIRFIIKLQRGSAEVVTGKENYEDDGPGMGLRRKESRTWGQHGGRIKQSFSTS